MATGRSERVKLFVENYYTYFQEGADTATIAKKYGISIGHAYTLLDEIAAINGVDKEIFYKIEHFIFFPQSAVSVDQRQMRTVIRVAVFEDLFPLGAEAADLCLEPLLVLFRFV